ncbi:MAG: oxidoreductase [Planctomycetes bacterium]|jgi:predicted dehydrogenase|nr:oxidoreductase [Planctomycetota bacterium]MDP6410269.1 Gfo/Idh/MocA family oxidoreductase [Planctomycetota bacterium]
MTERHPAPLEPSRRDLLRTTSIAAVAAGTSAPLASANASADPRPFTGPLRVGLIGCGGRGTGAAANALRADPDTHLVALGDTFGDHLSNCLGTLSKEADIAERVKVDEDKRFVGFDAYQGVIEHCDVVLLATSPHFRPMHVAAAVEAGKHLFVEKPIATDAPGVRAMRESCRRAEEKNLSIVSGLCYRYQRAKRETVARIHDGAIGDIVCMQTTYNTGGLWHRGRKEDWSEMEYQMRNWLYFAWLSGDHIAEQHIHSLDKIAWAMGDVYPTKCTSSGGRSVRSDAKYGNIYDHFNNVYEWENGVRCFSSCRQWSGAASDVSDYVYGTRGSANIQRHRIDAGPWNWRWKGDGPDDMYQNEHDALFAAIRSGEPINNGEYMCSSTMMAIMGRMSAYTGQTITWDQAWNSSEDLSPPAYEWGDLEMRPIAQPGITRFS